MCMCLCSELTTSSSCFWWCVVHLSSLLSCVLLLPCQGAFWGLTIGLTVGIIRMVLDFVYPAPLCFEVDNRPSVLKYVHYLYFSTMLSFLTLAVVLVVSLATEKPKPEQVSHHYEAISMTDNESLTHMQHSLTFSTFISPVCGAHQTVLNQGLSRTTGPSSMKFFVQNLKTQKKIISLHNHSEILFLWKAP